MGWAEETLEKMSFEERVGQLLCPSLGKETLEDLKAVLEEIPCGSVFLAPDTAENIRSRAETIQAAAKVPVLVTADLEHGPNAIYGGGETFPWMMAAGAAGSAELIAIMAEATAKTGRAAGVHWTFSPVSDLSLNWRNPVVNTRALGDNPNLLIRLLPAYIRALQAEGRMAGTAKHFPGDGVDERDHHLCTTVNSMPMEQWRQTYGRIWETVINANVMSIMCGHISLPDYQGHADDAEAAKQKGSAKRVSPPNSLF